MIEILGIMIGVIFILLFCAIHFRIMWIISGYIINFIRFIKNHNWNSEDI